LLDAIGRHALAHLGELAGLAVHDQLAGLAQRDALQLQLLLPRSGRSAG
jgi:hypothetical protein